MNIETIALLIGLLLFFILSSIEIFFGFIENEPSRKKWKVFPTLILGIALIIAFPTHPLVYVAVLLGCIGDLLLIWEFNKIMFLCGGVSFFTGHILYLVEIILTGKINLPWYGYIAIVAGYIAFFLFLVLTLKKKLGSILMVIAASFYFYILFLNFSLSIIAIINTQNYYLLMVTIGYLTFIVSDTMLSYKLFIREYKMDDFYIMFTYLLSQLMISMGLLLIYL